MRTSGSSVRRHLATIATALLVATTPSSTQAQSTKPVGYGTNTTGQPIVDLGYVSYLGWTNETAGISYFRGIQYAQAPTGQLRWRKPVAIEGHNDFNGALIDATEIAPACWQSTPKSLIDTLEKNPDYQSEDCLILDVLVPTQPVSKSLPVLVQIHGGGYTLHWAQEYPGDAMVNASNGNIIYVSIQYRLGVHGFLAGSQVKENGVLNAGLRDQRAALEWIQRNIRAFGGDPARVTIWGGSAGGGSVTQQLIAGGAYDQPPFSAAIADYPWWQPLNNDSTSDWQYRTVLQLAGCNDLECMRSLPSEKLGLLGQQVQDASYPSPYFGYGVFTFGPVVDGEFIRTLPGVAFQTGRFYDVPLLTTREGYEGWLFSDDNMTTMQEQTADAKDLFPYAGPAFFSRLYQLYPRSDYNSTFFQRQSWFGDFIINCPTYFMSSGAVDRNSNSSAVFKLLFDAGDEIHGALVPFQCSNITGWPDANNHTLAEIISSYWISFTVTHDPNPLRSPSAPFWQSYASGGPGTAEDGTSIGFTVNSVTYTTIGPETDPDASAQCEFFGNNGYVVRN